MAHAAIRTRPHVSLRGWRVPLLFGAAYGIYTQFIARSGGAANFGQLALALASGLALTVLIYGLLRIQHALPRELRAGAWGVLVGGAMGFLYSLTQHSILLSSVIGLVLGVSTTLVTFYAFYMREP
ncbi:hypothetical protein [Streptomyces liangshanensis]|uniref:Uncharacterized protein n=1 Tax=Streptomyces liangshanensis TaxID=2717324 RepID=A0A6G9GZL7_9ACTN|nr:hypothetical protein [Streptomyces liangshanensis]QIQ03718.1 hypothetical protein HA039_16540 [Streptomyces liangshanensis]